MTTCKYFGVRTSTRESGVKCQECKVCNSELFRKCTLETNTLIASSIDIDVKGNTVIVPPLGKVSDVVLIIER